MPIENLLYLFEYQSLLGLLIVYLFVYCLLFVPVDGRSEDAIVSKVDNKRACVLRS
jgi:hypothetical protein